MAYNIVKVNYALNVGEVSARFEGRQDKVEKYGAGCRTLENWLPLTMGGVTRRPGWAYVTKTKYSGTGNARVVLVDFRFSSTQAYVLEFGHLYVRFFKDGAALLDPDNLTIPLELVTPYTIDDLDLIKIGVFQSADVMYICTGIYPVYKLIRTDSVPDNFRILPVNFQAPATILDEPPGTEIAAGGLTLSALTGTGQTATAANAIFLDGDVGKLIVSEAGRAEIMSLTSASIADIDIIDDFDDLTIDDIDWHFEGFGEATMNLNKREAGEKPTITASIDTFRAADVGKYMSIYGGFVRIDSVTSAVLAGGTILTTLRDVPNDPATGLPFVNPPETSVWTIEVPAWSETFGYPVCGCFFQGRMWLCKGQQINGSVSGDYENFAKGSAGDDAIQRTIDDDQVNPIRWIKGLRSLQIGTGGSAYEVTASTQGKALTPSDFTVLPISSRGSANIPPIKVGGQLIYIQFGQKKLRELVFDFVTDKFKSPSLFILAEHLTETQFLVDATYQQEPDSVIWAVRSDGLLMALTYQEDENVIAWSTHPTTGSLIAVTNIPRPIRGVDWLWCAVEREINGVTETHIEFSEPDAEIDRQWTSLQTDSSKVGIPVAGVVSGAEHLEGATVRVIGDGMLFEDAVVTDGQFTLDPPLTVNEVEYGLDYQSNGLTLEPPIATNEGGMFLCRRWKMLGMRVRHAGPGLTLNVSDSLNIGLPVRKPYHLMDRAVPLQEGKLCAAQTNWGPFARVAFKQTLPFPAEVMNIIGNLEIGTDWCCDTEDELYTVPELPTECESDCPIGQFAKATYNGAMTIGGPAIRVDPISTDSAAYLVAALYFPTLNQISLVWYDGESNAELGTVLESTAFTLVTNDVLEIRSGARVAGVIQFTAYVNDVAVVGPVGNENIPEDASCATFFNLSGTLVETEVVTVGGVPVTVGGEQVTVTSL